MIKKEDTGQLSAGAAIKNKKKALAYDRQAVGMRLKTWRCVMGYTRKQVAGRIGIVEKYYSDIERGICGMSVETMIALADFFHCTLDNLIYGDAKAFEQDTLGEQIRRLSPQKQEYCKELVRVFMKSLREEPEEHKLKV